MNIQPYFRDRPEGGGGELVIPTGSGGHVVVELSVQGAWRLACDLMTWLRRRAMSRADRHDA